MEFGLLGRIACIAQVRSVATDVAHSVVCVSVCWHTGDLYKNG